MVQQEAFFRFIGIAKGAWRLDDNANESEKGFLLNHVISEELPPHADGDHISNSDPNTGQAGWYDVRVRIYPAGEDEPQMSYPQFNATPALPGTGKTGKVLKFFAGMFRKKAG